jgi:protein tyrosine phosphatase (PTP) superfamily phosphohydrolase (DUF442 family)
MKLSKILFTLSIILNIVFAVNFFNRSSIDSVTHATPHEEVQLPPANPEYDVVGIIPGIKKFVVKYNDKLFRGGLPYSKEGYEFLKKKEIKTVVSIVPDPNLKKWASKNDIKVIDLPFEKSKGISKAQREQLLDIYRTQNAPFYVHCHGGTHRASACAALYRTHLEGWDQEKAVKEYDLLGGDHQKEKTLIDSIN